MVAPALELALEPVEAAVAVARNAAGAGAGDAIVEVAPTASKLAIAASTCSAPAVLLVDRAPRRRASKLSSALARAASIALIFLSMTTILARCSLSFDWQSRRDACSDSSVALTC